MCQYAQESLVPSAYHRETRLQKAFQSHQTVSISATSLCKVGRSNVSHAHFFKVYPLSLPLSYCTASTCHLLLLSLDHMAYLASWEPSTCPTSTLHQLNTPRDPLSLRRREGKSTWKEDFALTKVGKSPSANSNCAPVNDANTKARPNQDIRSWGQHSWSRCR